MRESLWAFHRVFENGSLRRLQLAWAGSNVGAWAYTIAIAVYAFGEDGAYAVGLIGLARWVAAYVLSIVGTVIGTAFRPAQAALVPNLARSPEELTAANVTATTIESVGI